MGGMISMLGRRGVTRRRGLVRVRWRMKWKMGWLVGGHEVGKGETPKQDIIRHLHECRNGIRTASDSKGKHNS